VSFATITLCVASQRVFIVTVVYFVTTRYGNFWIHPRMARMGQKRNVYRNLVRKATGKPPLARPKTREQNNWGGS